MNHELEQRVMNVVAGVLTIAGLTFAILGIAEMLP